MNSAAPTAMRPATWGLIAVAGILLGGTTVFYSWTGSTSIFSYVALRILEGGVAYLHGWDIKGPGVYYFFALAHGALGPSPIAFRVLEVAWETATALTLGGIALHIYGRQATAVFAGLAYLLLYFSQNFWNFAISDGLLNLPLALSFLLLLRAMRRGHGWQWGAAGFLVGVAALFKLPFGLAGVPMLWAAWRCSPQGWKAVLQRWGWLAAGLAGCFAPVALYFYVKGAFGAFYSAYVLAAFSHTDRHREFLALPCFLENANKPVRYPLYAIALLGLVGVFAGRRGKPEGQRQAEFLLLMWLAVVAVVFLMHGAYADYHFLPAIAPVVVLAGGALARWLQGEGWPLRKLAIVAAVALLVVIPGEKFRQHLQFTYGALTRPRPPAFMHELSQKLRENTTAEDRIFVWGEIAEIYLDAGRKSPSRFATTYHLGTPMRYVNYRETFLGEFRANLPKYFVLIKSEKPEHPCAESLVDMQQAYYDFSELRAVVESEFHMVEDTPEYVLFRRNG